MPDIILGDTDLSAAAFEHRIRKAAGALLAYGVAEGDPLAIVLRNDISFLEIASAARRIGAQLIPVNWHLAPDELAYVLFDSDCKLALIDGHVLADVRESLPQGLDLIAVWPSDDVARAFGLYPVPASTEDWDALRDQAAPWDGAPRAARTAMSYTSGTTGRPKGVIRPALSPDEVLAVAAVNRHVFGLTEGACVIIPAPLYHGAPQAYLLQALQVADTLVVLPRFDARLFLETIARHQVTHLYAVPTMFVRLLALPQTERTRHDLSSLTFALHGAAHCSTGIKRAMIDWWGPVIHEFYGGTEAGPITSISSEEWLKRPGSAGRAAPGARIAVLDDKGAPVPSGETGRIFVRQTAYPDFTYHGLEAERLQISCGDLFTLGDLGHLDADGYLYVTDREKDLVISGGVNIYPAEVEMALIMHPDVSDCAVIGLPDAEFGERLAAIIVPVGKAQLTLEDVTGFLAGRISRQKFPREVISVDSLPRQESGKLFKRGLVADLCLGKGRSVTA